eukprot:m.745301 g.745301  ORF g.745301 m.745301 type:complete len:63 (+) comp23127_c3_seq12:153-341(+)
MLVCMSLVMPLQSQACQMNGGDLRTAVTGSAFQKKRGFCTRFKSKKLDVNNADHEIQSRYNQ